MKTILTDIEGTTSSISFVKDVLFPYARRALPAFVAAHGDEPAVRRWLDAVATELGAACSDDLIVETLQGWIDQDRKHTALKALQGMAGFWDTPDVFLTARTDYIERARNRACVPYALVHKSEWVGKGTMGWWGLSTGDVDEDNWNRTVNEMLDALPDDTLITVVDCHI